MAQKDRLLNLVVIDSLRKIRQRITGEFLTDPEIDPEKLYQQGSRVLAGKRRKIYFPPPLAIHVDVSSNPALRALVGRFLQASAERLALYEGRMAEIEIDTYTRKARVTHSNAQVDVVSVRTVEYENGPEGNAKIDVLHSMLTKKHRKRCLVLTRNTDVNGFILGLLRKLGISSEPIVGHMDDEKRRDSLEKFRNGDANVLIVNRQVGGRGFDLPLAQFCIFLSPKRSEETMWQEMLRIRSSRKDIKDVFILYFNGTQEEEKAVALLEKMQSLTQKYRLNVQVL